MRRRAFSAADPFRRYNPAFAAQYGAPEPIVSRPLDSGPVAGPSSGAPVASGSGSHGFIGNLDDGSSMTMQAGAFTIDTSISNQNSIYTPRNARAANRPKDAPGHIARTTVIRKGGGETWEDPTLLDWDPSHFRLFVGNLGNDVSDDGLTKAFNGWPSFVRAKVIRDKFTTKVRDVTIGAGGLNLRMPLGMTLLMTSSRNLSLTRSSPRASVLSPTRIQKTL